MKRILLLLVCVTVLVCLLASPAYAGKGVEPYRPPENATVIDLFGWWWEYVPSTGSFWDEVIWYQTYDRHDKKTYRAVAMDRPVYLYWIFWGVDYGTVSGAGDILPCTVDVTGPGGYSQHYDPKEVKAYWAGPYPWDWWWNTFAWYWGGGVPFDALLEPFNPNIGAGVYGNCLMLPLGPFTVAGKYTVTETFTKGRPYVSRTYWEEFTHPLPPDPTAPYEPWILVGDYYVQ